jgi:hypothetical protein
MSDKFTLDVIGTTGGKATVEVRRPPVNAEVEKWSTFMRRRKQVNDRVAAIVIVVGCQPQRVKSDCISCETATGS